METGGDLAPHADVLRGFVSRDETLRTSAGEARGDFVLLEMLVSFICIIRA